MYIISKVHLNNSRSFQIYLIINSEIKQNAGCDMNIAQIELFI